MRKMLTIFFLTIYVVSTTELGQLLKIPALVEHYFEHKKKSSEVSIINFLVHHYKGNHLKNHPFNRDYERDQNLPFMNSTVLSMTFVLSPLVTFEISERAQIIDAGKARLRNDQFVDNIFLSSIWQPPRCC